MNKFLIFISLLFANVVFSQTCNNPPNPLAVTDFPYLDDSASGFLSLNVLTIVIRSTLVNNRSQAVISLQGYSDANCNAPGVNWQRTEDDVNCIESYTANLPWSLLSSSCGLAQTNNTDTIVFTGTILVNQVEILSEINGQNITRSIDTPFNFQLIFPRNVQVNSSDPVIFAPINVEAAVTHVGFTMPFGDINLFTSIQYPFILTNPSVSINSSSLNGFISVLSTNGCPAESYCTTTYEIDVNGTSGAPCWLNGTYTVSFDIACNSAWTNNCPLEGNTVEIVFSTTSSNLCGLFSDTVDISATLSTYASNVASNTQETFLQNQFIYLRAVTTSQQVSLVNTYLLNCTSIYDPNSASTLLYSSGSSLNNGAVSSPALDASFTLISNNATQANFKLNATYELYPIPTDSYASMVISCWLGVEYQDVITSKRNVLQMKSSFIAPNSKKVSHSKLAIAKRNSNSQALSANARFSVIQTTQTTQSNQPTLQMSSATKNNNNVIFLITAFVFFVMSLY
jgi:hypothetical protein